MRVCAMGRIIGLLVLIVPSNNFSYAAEIEISGYASFKVISNVNKDGASYYNQLAKTSYSNFDSRENNIGVQFYTDISDNMDMTVVFSTRGGSNQKYNVETEWAYVNYRFSDDLSLRIGKVKGPFYMVSDYKDVGYAYPWVSPPEEVYSTNPIRSLNGLDLVYQTTVYDVSLLAEIYTGGGTNTAFAQANSIADGALPGITAVGTQIDFVTRNMIGFNTSVGYQGIALRLGYFKTKVDFGTATDLDGEFGGVGITVDVKNIVVYSEYVFRDTDPQLIAAFPDQRAYYLTTGYRLRDYLPYVTIAKLYQGKDLSPYTLVQKSTAIGLRVEIGDTAALKFEAANKTPTGYGLYDAVISGSGSIYTIALDLLF